jgi:ATP adenylyltransferase
MEHLWSPWRYDYVASVGTTPRTCPFCVGADPSEDPARLVVHRATHNFIILNLFPYTVGHLLIAPYAHMAKLDDAAPEQMSEMMELVQRGIATLRKLYQPEGFNIGMNLGHCAGAGIREHLHMHVIPRWIGDANVISVVGETRVLSEDLGVTYRRFIEACEFPRG